MTTVSLIVKYPTRESEEVRTHRLDQVFVNQQLYSTRNAQVRLTLERFWKIARILTKLAIRVSHSWPTTNCKLQGLRWRCYLCWSSFNLLCDAFELLCFPTYMAGGRGLTRQQQSHLRPRSLQLIVDQEWLILIANFVSILAIFQNLSNVNHTCAFIVLYSCWVHQILDPAGISKLRPFLQLGIRR